METPTEQVMVTLELTIHNDVPDDQLKDKTAYSVAIWDKNGYQKYYATVTRVEVHKRKEG